MSVKRWRAFQDRGGWSSALDEASDGAYVRFTDYEVQAAELAIAQSRVNNAVMIQFERDRLAAELAAIGEHSVKEQARIRELTESLMAKSAKIGELEAALRGMIAVADGEAGNTPWRNIDAARAALETPVSVSTSGTVRRSARDMLVPRSAKKKKSAGRQKCNCSIPKGFRHASWCASEVGLVPETADSKHPQPEVHEAWVAALAKETPVQRCCSCFGVAVCNKDGLAHDQYCGNDRRAAGLAQETDVCQYCGKELPDGCRTEFQGESACEGYSVPTPETSCECMPLAARGMPGDLEIYCPKCGKVFRESETAVKPICCENAKFVPVGGILTCEACGKSAVDIFSETSAKAVIGAALRECCPYCGAAPRNPHDYAYPHPPETKGVKP